MHSLAMARAKGVARNSMAPEEVLLRLINAEHTLRFTTIYRIDLPESVYDAVVAHPEWHVRSTMANCWNTPAIQRARLASDPDARVRLAVAMEPQPFRQPVEPLPDETYVKLANDTEVKVRAEIATKRSLPEQIRFQLVTDPEPLVRSTAISCWPGTPPSNVIETMLVDPDPSVRHAARMTQPETAVEELLNNPKAASYARADWAAVVPLSPEQANILANDESAWVRAGLASNPTIPPDIVERLATDADHQVRLAVSMRQELTEKQRAEIDYRVAPEDRLSPARWVIKNLADLDTMARCVHSAHIGLRRSAAYSPDLTPDLVAVLAHDPDFAVRLLLCENHPDAPADLLLATLLEANVITRYDLIHKPNFPRAGLARFASSEDPEARHLAFLDPGTSPEVIEHLSNDPVAYIQAAAACDPRLPIERVLQMLDDESTAEAAACHQDLPIELMSRFLDEAGVPPLLPQVNAI